MITQLLALTACSRLKRTQPLNQHFFFFVVVFFLFVLFAPPPLPGIFSLEKSIYFSRRGATATWPRGLVRWQVPPERHMRIVFTCEVLYRDPERILLQFVIQQNQPGRGGRRRNWSTKRLSQHGLHTQHEHSSRSPRFAISFLNFPSFLCTKIAAPVENQYWNFIPQTFVRLKWPLNGKPHRRTAGT